VSAASAGILGALAGLGVILVIAGLRRTAAPEPRPRLSQLAGRVRQEATMPRVAGTVITAAVVAAVTRWPAGTVLAGLAAWFLPRALGSDREHARALERIEAIATFTEMLVEDEMQWRGPQRGKGPEPVDGAELVEGKEAGGGGAASAERQLGDVGGGQDAVLVQHPQQPPVPRSEPGCERGEQPGAAGQSAARTVRAHRAAQARCRDRVSGHWWSPGGHEADEGGTCRRGSLPPRGPPGAAVRAVLPL
jgi:hypothetical protein